MENLIINNPCKECGSEKSNSDGCWRIVLVTVLVVLLLVLIGFILGIKSGYVHCCKPVDGKPSITINTGYNGR